MAQTQRGKGPAKPAKSAKPPQKAPPKPRPGASGATPILEWVAATVGFILMVFTIGAVASEAFRADTSPPSVTARNLGVEHTDAGYLVRVRVTNGGGSAASGVTVEGTLTTEGADPETSEATFDFLADHSSREGGLYFRTDPRAGKLTLRAKGYSEP